MLSIGCTKEFLDKKPSSAIVAPTTLEDLKSLLENVTVFASTTGLSQISADEYIVASDQSYNTLPTLTERNAYIWSKDMYQGEIGTDWNKSFQQIFYANSVLDVIGKSNFSDKQEANRVKGRACFVRAYAYYDLARNFCKVYTSQTANSDLGLPIRTESGVDIVKSRATLKQTFDQIISDLDIAGSLLDAPAPVYNKNQPSKAAVMALKARMYLYMGSYDDAEKSADTAMQIYKRLTDYNTISTTVDYPFSNSSEEVIYSSQQINSYAFLVSANSSIASYRVDSQLYNLYVGNDLRKKIFFKQKETGRYSVKRIYLGPGLYPFSGLATDELYLIKAECLARRKQTGDAMTFLNQLLINRYDKNTVYIPASASSPEQALAKVLEERKKELIFRSLRWSDLKRYNRDGANIVLTRSINGQNYTLPPNDPKYVFPIPDQEIALSGIEQNQR
ncbi:RagB/SusD family nutrient uptake outer membrane protein [Mucilaginibacter pineti]|nr:RagB/SusD family nutrient uptake outer membrane protein [Mucilaginibacter pineti]